MNLTNNQAIPIQSSNQETLSALDPSSKQKSKAESIQEVSEFQEAFKDIERELNNPQTNYIYVISSKWLQRWKQCTSDKDIQTEEKWLGSLYLGKINQDLVQTYNNAVIYPDAEDYRNVFLKEGIEEKKDYELLTETAWMYLAKRYNHITIKRPIYDSSDGKRKPEIVLQQIRVAPINSYLLRSIDHKRCQEFHIYLIQMSKETSLKDFKQDLVTISIKNGFWLQRYNRYYTLSGEFVSSTESSRLWRLDPALDLRGFFKKIRVECAKSPSYDYRIEFCGEYLGKNDSVRLKEIEIGPIDFVFFEAIQEGKQWLFYGDGAETLEKCKYCEKYRKLISDRQKAQYCSEDCRSKDLSFHKLRCDIFGKNEN